MSGNLFSELKQGGGWDKISADKLNIWMAVSGSLCTTIVKTVRRVTYEMMSKRVNAVCMLLVQTWLCMWMGILITIWGGEREAERERNGKEDQTIFQSTPFKRHWRKWCNALLTVLKITWGQAVQGHCWMALFLFIYFFYTFSTGHCAVS